MPLDDLPPWARGWCRRHLGAEPVDVAFRLDQMSVVLGVVLDDGTVVVLKARPDDGCAASGVAAQAGLAARGFPCARPLTGVTRVGPLAVHAEEHRPGGDLLPGDSPAVAARYAVVFARIVTELELVDVALPPASPRWVAWDHRGPGLWPAVATLDALDQDRVPDLVTATAFRARDRLRAAALPRVLGHADYEAQNLRWHGDAIWAVHDWDSLAHQPEAALVGAASGTFPRCVGPPTLAPLASSEAFLDTYEASRRRAFTAEEREVAWAASLWPAAHNARWEALHGDPPVAGTALADQAAERLRRAGA
ncbi:phosphotransferase [Actinomycetospora chiangmaiensis]|uniref:phosphotransferase n=1 Tax=Actinomycetospora chiangmaiensis TaxID=402650 RepID=UPI00036E0308|nr:phosphotransferase [Actinomycetospora chiangmaiensis]